MLSTFATIKNHVKFNPSKPSIDNIVFKLHYRVTFILLLACCILVCSREYFGQHISCIADSGVPPHVIATYCFFTSTFTVVRHYNASLIEKGFLPHPGVGPIGEDEETRFHAYYQWVPFVLFGQAIMFFIPHYLWRKAEGGRIKALVDGLQMARLSLRDVDMSVNGALIPSKNSLADRLETIKKDIILRLHASRTWSTWLVACEVANLLNIILQIWLTNKFLNGLFYGLGPDLFGVDWNGPMDPLELIFPKVTKCEFHKYGPSGSIQKHDALCVMALNVINEKIFSILWFWYYILLIASILGLFWRALSFILYRRSVKFNDLVFRSVSPGKFNSWNVVAVTRGCQYGDWLFLYYLGKNMNGFVFRELFSRVADELQKGEIPYDVTEKNENTVVLLANDREDEDQDEGMDSLKEDLKDSYSEDGKEDLRKSLRKKLSETKIKDS